MKYVVPGAVGAIAGAVLASFGISVVDGFFEAAFCIAVSIVLGVLCAYFMREAAND